MESKIPNKLMLWDVNKMIINEGHHLNSQILESS